MAAAIAGLGIVSSCGLLGSGKLYDILPEPIAGLIGPSMYVSLDNAMQALERNPEDIILGQVNATYTKDFVEERVAPIVREGILNAVTLRGPLEDYKDCVVIDIHTKSSVSVSKMYDIIESAIKDGDTKSLFSYFLKTGSGFRVRCYIDTKKASEEYGLSAGDIDDLSKSLNSKYRELVRRLTE